MSKVSAESTRDFVIALLGRHVAPEIPVEEESDLVADLALDSILIVEMLAEIEDTFELRVEEEALEGVTTVGDLIHALDAARAVARQEEAS